MSQMVTNQSLLFITSVQIGIFMGALFDLIRIFRKLIRHPNFIVQIEDMLYWIVCGFMGFYMLYICNYAEIRIYVFIGMILGGIFYFCTFSIIFMKIATLIIEYIKKFVSWLYHLILIPIRGMINLIKIPIRYMDKKKDMLQYNIKLKHRQIKRKQYEQKADQRVNKYLKKKVAEKSN